MDATETFRPGTGRNRHGQHRRNEPAPAPRRDITAAGAAAQNTRVDRFLAAYAAAQDDSRAGRITAEGMYRRIEAARAAQAQAA